MLFEKKGNEIEIKMGWLLKSEIRFRKGDIQTL